MQTNNQYTQHIVVMKCQAEITTQLHQALTADELLKDELSKLLSEILANVQQLSVEAVMLGRLIERNKK